MTPAGAYIYYMKNKMWYSIWQVTQQEKSLATEPDNLSLMPET